MPTSLSKLTNSSVMPSTRRAPVWSRMSTPPSECRATLKTPRRKINMVRTLPTSKNLLISRTCNWLCSMRQWMAPRLSGTTKSTTPGQTSDPSVSTNQPSENKVWLGISLTSTIGMILERSWNYSNLNVTPCFALLFRLEGNQYTYKGNDYCGATQNKAAVESTVSNAIGNQEIGKSPIEYTNQLSRAKVYDMKSIRVPDQVRSYNNLYQE